MRHPPNPPPSLQTVRPRLSGLQKKLAAQHGCAYFDTLKHMGGRRAFDEWVMEPNEVLEDLWKTFDLRLTYDLVDKLKDGSLHLYRRDGIHLTSEGYYLLAEIFITALMNAFDQYRFKQY